MSKTTTEAAKVSAGAAQGLAEIADAGFALMINGDSGATEARVAIGEAFDGFKWALGAEKAAVVTRTAALSAGRSAETGTSAQL